MMLCLNLAPVLLTTLLGTVLPICPPHSHLYSDRLNLSLFERLHNAQIDPPRRPCQFGNGAPRSEREQSSLRFGFVSSVQKGTNSTDPSIEASNALVAPQERPLLLLYYAHYCPHSQKVLRYLQQIHKQVPMKDVGDNPQAKEELRKSGGEMRVPCLLIDGQPLYAADQIIQWLSQHQDLLDPS